MQKFAFSVSGRVPARSCEDLQLVGIGNGSFVIQIGNDVSLQDCAVPGTYSSGRTKVTSLCTSYVTSLWTQFQI